MKIKLLFIVLLLVSTTMFAQKTVEKWAMYEISIKGPSNGNPYKDYNLHATFVNGEDSHKIKGFYDGDGNYKIRFMPTREGTWKWVANSNTRKLNGKKGQFNCIPPTEKNKGPVKVVDSYHFAYADGTSYKPFGTTSYVWTHQLNELQEQTVKTLSSVPFNKMRMCVFPKNYTFNKGNPDYYVFQGDSKENFDYTKFNPEYWMNLEKRIIQLQELGIEVDLILFHPYDNGKWGFDQMPDEVDDFYLDYLIARLSAYRNIWWSLANEFHLMNQKTEDDWDRFGKILVENDPYGHLLSNHNHPAIEFDWSKDYITHVSIQHDDQVYVGSLIEKFNKPVINDECQYEGDLLFHWGNISAKEMMHRYWLGTVHGIYTTHGETYLDDKDILWWSKGGILKGQSPERIGFLRKIMEEGPSSLNSYSPNWIWQNKAIGDISSYLLIYFGVHQPSYWNFEFPVGKKYTIELINPWTMTIEKKEGTFEGKARVDLPGDPYLALRVKAIE